MPVPINKILYEKVKNQCKRSEEIRKKSELALQKHNKQLATIIADRKKIDNV